MIYHVYLTKAGPPLKIKAESFRQYRGCAEFIGRHGGVVERIKVYSRITPAEIDFIPEIKQCDTTT